MQASGSDLPALLHAASVLRDRYKGHNVSYSRKVFIPLTNICRDRCGYCTFRKDPWEDDAKTMTPDEVLAVAEAGAKLGCKEALSASVINPRSSTPNIARAWPSSAIDAHSIICGQPVRWC